MEALSDELLVHTFRLVGWKDVATRVALVCRRWREVGRDDALWHFFFRSHYQAKDDEEKRIALGGGGGGEAESWMDRFRARRMERRVGLEWWRRAYVPRRNEGLVRLPPTQIDDLPRDLILKQDQEFKVVVMGPVGVGKSALVIQFDHYIFIAAYDPTIEDTYRKQTVVNGTRVTLEVLDTAELNTEEYSAMRERYMRSGHVFILVYSATSMASFRALSHYYDQVYQVVDAELVPIVLVENKIDLVDAREVPQGAGEMAAKALGCLFVSASAKTREGVDDVFHGAVKLCAAVRAELHAVDQRQQRRARTHKQGCLLS